MLQPDNVYWIIKHRLCVFILFLHTFICLPSITHFLSLKSLLFPLCWLMLPLSAHLDSVSCYWMVRIIWWLQPRRINTFIAGGVKKKNTHIFFTCWLSERNEHLTSANADNLSWSLDSISDRLCPSSIGSNWSAGCFNAKVSMFAAGKTGADCGMLKTGPGEDSVLLKLHWLFPTPTWFKVPGDWLRLWGCGWI